MQNITSVIILFVTNAHYPFLMVAEAHNYFQADMIDKKMLIIHRHSLDMIDEFQFCC